MFLPDQDPSIQIKLRPKSAVQWKSKNTGSLKKRPATARTGPRTLPDKNLRPIVKKVSFSDDKLIVLQEAPVKHDQSNQNARLSKSNNR